ncbi:MAG: CPBP family intramembrane metalloprotease, partial [Bacteroidales bacterium]|nr:CPBP family intramembrane metalloprotease [Bacteroidales bacterium]
MLTALIGGGNEELGWRGYLTPQLMKKFNPLISCVMVGVIWVFWHLPLYFLDSWSGGDQPIILFLLYAIPLSVILTWLYYWSKQSIIPVMLLHSATNIIFEYFPRLDIVIKSLSFDFNVLKAAAYLIVALLIIT